MSATGPGEFEGTPTLESSEFEIPTTEKPSKKSRKRRRTDIDQEDLVEFVKPEYLFTFQQVVLLQQMEVFSAQLQLIEVQKDNYRLKYR